MKQITYFSLLIIAALFIVACTNEDKQMVSSLSADLASMGLEELSVFNIDQEIDQTLSLEEDSITFTFTEDVLLDLASNRRHNYIYVHAGEQLSLDTVSSDPLLISTVGTRTPENEYLLSFARLVNELEETQPTFDFGGSNPDSFLLLLNQKYTVLEDFVEQLKADDQVSEYFQTAMANRVLGIKGNELIDYKYLHQYLKKEFPELPADFYKELATADLSAKSLLLFEEGRKLPSNWISRDISYENYDDVSDYFGALLANAKEAFPGTLVGDYCRFKTLEDFINFGNGIDHAEEAIADFQTTVANQYLQQQLATTITPWMDLKSGSVAPDFQVRNRTGEQVQLSDLKGKKVYIDVWATWCGPCIREIPALKELETEMHDENIEFVSVSIDKEEDQQKWLDFIEEKDLKGIQLMADGAWKSDIVQAYNIRGIPRFLLVDAEGKIISADAPRPSSPKIREVLLD